jgi:hypothetical protein
MNNDIVNNETDLLYYRLRTERERKRAQRKGFEKKLRALDRERRDLWQKQRNLGWVKLEKPVIRGWKRFFVLRDDVAESIHAEFFKSILDKIGTVNFSNRKDFKARKKRVKKWGYETKKQELLKPEAWQLKKMNFTEKEQSFFEEKVILNKHRLWVKVYEFKEPWRFVLKIKPNMITHTRVRNVEMESRAAELDNYFDMNYLQPRLDKLYGWSYKYRRDYEKRQEVYVFENKPLREVLDAVKEE